MAIIELVLGSAIIFEIFLSLFPLLLENLFDFVLAPDEGRDLAPPLSISSRSFAISEAELL